MDQMLLKVFPTLQGWCSNCVFVINIAILFYVNVEEAACFSRDSKLNTFVAVFAVFFRHFSQYNTTKTEINLKS